MSKITTCLAVILIIMSLIVGPSLSSLISSTTVNTTGVISIVYSNLTLHIDGRYVKNPLNQTIYLRGVNRPSGFTYSCSGNWFTDGASVYSMSQTYSETGLRQRLQQMQDAGFNVVRLIFTGAWWINNSTTTIDSPPRTTNVPFRTALTETVRIAQEYGIYCVLTLYGSDVGAQQSMPFPSTAIPDQAAFVNFWADVADNFKQYPNALFELYNEPAGSQSTWNNAVVAAVQGIRSTGASNLIVIQYGYCGSCSFIPTLASLLTGQTNILYSNHIYNSPSGATIPPGISDYNTIKSTLVNSWGYSNSTLNSYPLWIGEFGAAPSDSTFFANLQKVLNDWGLGYAAWEWDQPGTGWDLQSGSSAPYQPNTNGQTLINGIANP